MNTALDTFRKTLTDLYNFALRPEHGIREKAIDQRHLTQPLISLLIIGYVGSGVFLVMAQVIQSYAGLDLGEHLLAESDLEPMFLIVSGIIIAPLFEEVIFRSWLSFRRAYFILWLVMINYEIFTRASHFKTLRLFRGAWQKYFPLIFYLSVLIFGMVHIMNFENYQDYLWFAPLITLPQLFLGITLGYTRLKYGLINAILLHAMHNGLLITLALIFE